MPQSRKIHFIVSARDLPMKEGGCAGPRVQDPYIKWSQKDNQEGEFKFVKETNHRNNDPNPDWYDCVLSYDWAEGTGQLWRFEVMDHEVLCKDDHIGFVDVDVDNYVLQKNEEESVKLDCQGTVLLKKCEPIQFRLAARDLPKLDPFDGLSDPYVQCFWSFGMEGPATLFATTKTITNVEHAVWDEIIEFPNYQIGTNQYWTFKVYDKDPLPTDDAIGQVSIEVDGYVKLKNLLRCNLSKGAGTTSQLIVSPADLFVAT